MKQMFPILVATVSLLYAQKDYQWSPFEGVSIGGGRYEDLTILNQSTYIAIKGDVYKTTDHGEHWNYYPTYPLLGVRCVNFFDTQKGFIGCILPENPLIKTTDGGQTWKKSEISGYQSKGICGLWKVDDSVMYGCGLYSGPPSVVKTTDGGISWKGIDMSTYCTGLVDCYFYSADSGFVVGAANIKVPNSQPVILFTSDGGNHWETVYLGLREKEWCWKIYFLNDTVGYVSIQAKTNTPVKYLKTTNRGKTWEEFIFLNGVYDVQGIGFLNEQYGWIGGWTGPTYQTTDSGKSWNQFYYSVIFKNLNRVRRLNDSVILAAGNGLFKYSKISPASVVVQTDQNRTFELHQNYPNPFNPSTSIRIHIPEYSNVRITIFNSLGQAVRLLVDLPMPSGTYDVEWEAVGFPSGMYFYTLTAGTYSMTKKMTLLK